MTKRWIWFERLVLVGLGALAPGGVTAQQANATSLEQWIRSGYEFAWAAGEPMREEVREVWSELGSGGVGYGFRTFQAREARPETVPVMEYWRVVLDELHTSVVGEIGLAWGVHVEEFRTEGGQPESVRVRFTNTLRWDGQGWKNLLYHRDAQAFEGVGM